MKDSLPDGGDSPRTLVDAEGAPAGGQGRRVSLGRGVAVEDVMAMVGRLPVTLAAVIAVALALRPA